MLNENQEKIIKEEFNKYINNIKIPENLEEIIMEDMNKIENDEMNENQNREKKFSAKKAIGIAAAVVIVAGVVGVTGLKTGWFNNNNKQSAIAESQSESGKGTKVVGGDKTKSLYDIEEYTDNLTDAANGKLAFLKLLENNELQTEKHGDYYTYIDQFENKYNIKEITNVTSGEGTMGVDNWAALFKVTVIYIDNTNRTNTMDLAIILLPNHEVQNRGTYDNFTGTTSYVKNFTNLYNDNEESSISGLYKYNKDFNEQLGIGYYLYLYSNGTFKYEHSSMAATGEIGEYTINGDNLILNTQYKTGSDVGIGTSNDVIKLTINSDGSITDKNNFFSFDDFYGLDKKYKNFDFGNIKMTKASESEDKEYLKVYPSIQNIIDNSIISNEDSDYNTSIEDYRKYFGTWSDEKGSEFTVENIGNNLITYTWFIYRTASMDDVTVPFENNKAVFYYSGVDDLNYNSVIEENEHFYRKATIQLRENDIIVTVQDVTPEEHSNNLRLEKEFNGGGVYVKAGEYVYSKKLK